MCQKHLMLCYTLQFQCLSGIFQVFDVTYDINYDVTYDVTYDFDVTYESNAQASRRWKRASKSFMFGTVIEKLLKSIGAKLMFTI